SGASSCSRPRSPSSVASWLPRRRSRAGADSEAGPSVEIGAKTGTMPNPLTASEVSENVAFAVGSKVVYPSHGVAQIVRREKRVLDGEKLEYLILEVPQQGWGTSGAMTVAVPENRAEGLGVRPAI